MNNALLSDTRKSEPCYQWGQDRPRRSNGLAVTKIATGSLEHLFKIHPRPSGPDTLPASGFVMPYLTRLNAMGSGIGGLSQGVGLPSPTCVVASGHGLHAYWRLTEACRP